MSPSRKPVFIFHENAFSRIKEKGNTHFCFHCGSSNGFRPETRGFWLFKKVNVFKPTNHITDSGYNPMSGHCEAHRYGIVGNIQKYRYAIDWLEGELVGLEFPFEVFVK